MKTDRIQGILFQTSTTVPVHLQAKAQARAQIKQDSKPVKFLASLPTIKPDVKRISRRAHVFAPTTKTTHAIAIYKKFRKH